MGTPQAAVPTLERIVADEHEVVAIYTQPDRPSGRRNKVIFSPVKQFGIDHGIPVLQPLKVRTEEALTEFRSHNADVAVVVAYGRILPKGFLEAYPKGAINVHFSLLPKYRGAAPVNWAIVNGETETGVTTMLMDEGLDTGAVLMMRSTRIGEDETAIDLMQRLSALGAELLSDTLKDLNDIISTQQDHEKATFAPIMKRSDGLIDWSSDAKDVIDRIRGFQPFPGSYSYFRGSRMMFWAASLVEGHSNAQPGTITEITRDAIIVACGNNAIAIKELQPDGKKRMAARDVMNGIKPAVDEIFTSTLQS